MTTLGAIKKENPENSSSSLPKPLIYNFGKPPSSSVDHSITHTTSSVSRLAPVKGSGAFIWIQDPTLKINGSKTEQIYMPNGIPANLSNKMIKVVYGDGTPVIIPPDANNHFFYNPDDPKQLRKFDAVSLFCVVQQIFDTYQKLLMDWHQQGGFGWEWWSDKGGKPLTLVLDANAGKADVMNADYERDNQCINFYHFANPNNKGTGNPGDPTQIIGTWRMTDVIRHETGHAICDRLNPLLLESESWQTGALHEAFGDMNSLFMLLQDQVTCKMVYSYSFGNLHNDSFFPDLAEQFGAAVGLLRGLRSAINTVTLTEVLANKKEQEVHFASQVMTGAVYDILSDMWDATKQNDTNDADTDRLRVAGNHLMGLVAIAYKQAPKNATFSDICANMLRLETDKDKRQIIANNFAKRGISTTPTATVTTTVTTTATTTAASSLAHSETEETNKTKKVGMR
ncbi:MAG: M36 family metallopeptidase [Proteobacteria bacterium]|nr:M36 family metallopeptidase [Pseudomonadota bacterium]